MVLHRPFLALGLKLSAMPLSYHTLTPLAKWVSVVCLQKQFAVNAEATPQLVDSRVPKRRTSSMYSERQHVFVSTPQDSWRTGQC